MNALTRTYYKITAHLPRKLPRTPLEFSNLRKIMIDAYLCNDQPSTTMVLAGQVTSTEAHKIRKSYAHIANCIKRLEINAIAAEFRGQAIAENNQRLADAAQRVSDAMKAEEEQKEHDQTSEIISEAHGQPEPSGAPDSQSVESAEITVPSVL
jgi:hypothetical protein